MEYDYKLDYITRLFRKIKNKRFEAYVIQRIWDLLNDDTIRFVTQQYFRRNDAGEYALTDLYLPQINMIIEIDEGQHIPREREDILRSKDIMQIKAVEGVCIERIALCDKNTSKAFTMSEVHRQIDVVVEKIKESVAQLGDKFQPWDDELWTPEYYKRKGYFRVSDDDYIKSINDAAAVFNTKAKHRGYLRAAGFDVPNKENVIVWCPAKDNKLWYNELKEEEEGRIFIYEHNKNSLKRDEHVQKHIAKEGRETRITFFREKDDLGFYFYKFVGVFEIDAFKSRERKECVWVRKSDEYRI